jgi:hypothetical protein
MVFARPIRRALAAPPTSPVISNLVPTGLGVRLPLGDTHVAQSSRKGKGPIRASADMIAPKHQEINDDSAASDAQHVTSRARPRTSRHLAMSAPKDTLQAARTLQYMPVEVSSRDRSQSSPGPPIGIFYVTPPRRLRRSTSDTSLDTRSQIQQAIDESSEEDQPVRKHRRRSTRLGDDQ